MRNFCLTRFVLSLPIVAALQFSVTSAHAAFFQLQENATSTLGNANAGAAASAEDASTVWFNPAGLTRLGSTQALVAGHYIQPSTKFNVSSATRTAGSNISGATSGDAGESAFVPNFYYASPMSERLAFGLGITVPFGLATDYEDNWAGRYHADRSEIKTANVNPSLGYRLNDQLSIGAGINYQKIEAEITQAVDVATVSSTPGQPDGDAAVTADDATWGYNVGLLWDLMPDTRLGLAYRSQMSYMLSGNFDFTPDPTTNPLVVAGIAAAGVRDSGAHAAVDLPATMSISVFHKLNPMWAVMADVTRTNWSSLSELRIDFDSNQPDSLVTLELKNVNRYSVGATYMPGGPWSYRTGIALDKTPVPNSEHRTPRLPDADRLWLAVGANYRISQGATLDLAFVHIEMDDAVIEKTATGTNENASRGNLDATFEGSVDILSVQGSWSF